MEQTKSKDTPSSIRSTGIKLRTSKSQCPNPDTPYNNTRSSSRMLSALRSRRRTYLKITMIWTLRTTNKLMAGPSSATRIDSKIRGARPGTSLNMLMTLKRRKLRQGSENNLQLSNKISESPRIQLEYESRFNYEKLIFNFMIGIYSRLVTIKF